MNELPPLVEKALVDSGYDLIEHAGTAWTTARISGSVADAIAISVVHEGTVLASREPGVTARIGLAPWDTPAPGMSSAGLARTPQELYRALRLLRTIAVHPLPALSAEVEARLARIPETERTREVRERIGQDVFRDALTEFWGNRCALSVMALPRELLRASHAKPWRDASDAERLDPFNGLLLAVRYDALFDKGLIAFNDDGGILLSSFLTIDVCAFVGLNDTMHLRYVLPGHVPYLSYHREHVARL